MLYTRQILFDDDLQEVRENLAKVSFEDGINTLDAPDESHLAKVHQMKKCLNHTNGCPYAQRIGEIILGGIDKDAEFITSTAALRSGYPIISRTEAGMYYRPHNDIYSVGNYSTTVFLNDPEEYEGGYLRLRVGQDVQEVKLRAGWAVTYDTGIPHEVTDVEEGRRDVGVFWTSSKYSDARHRSIYTQILKAIAAVPQPAQYPQSLEAHAQEPHYILKTLENEYQRMFPPDS